MFKKKISKVVIDYNSTIEHALKKININKLQFCFLIDNKNKLKGIVTDGDIRRAILNKKNFKDKVNTIIVRKFKYLYDYEIFLTNKEKYLDKYNFNHIPIVNKKNELVDYITRIKKNKSYEFKNVMVLILAGGYGKRLLPLTKNTPKPMVLLKNKPILEYLINKLEFFELKNILISTFYKSAIIKKYFENGKKFNVKLNYMNEKKPMGTAGSIKFLKNKNYKHFLIYNSDVFTNLDLNKFIDFHIGNKADLTIFSVKNKIHINYGVLKNKGRKVINVEEKPVLENKILGGIYLINKKIISLCIKNYIDMDELVNLAIRNKLKVEYFLDENVFWSDLGTIDDLEKMNNLNVELLI